MLTHAHIPCTQDAEAGGWMAEEQPGLHVRLVVKQAQNKKQNRA